MTVFIWMEFLYDGDPDTWISEYSYVIDFCGTPITSKLKIGKSVTLSSTEEEWYAISEITKKEIFEKHK
jgi:hypothetical protein